MGCSVLLGWGRRVNKYDRLRVYIQGGVPGQGPETQSATDVQEEGLAGAAVVAGTALRQVGDVWRPAQGLGNLLGGLESSDEQQAVTGLGQGLGDVVGGLGLTLGPDDGSLSLLVGLVDKVLGPLRVLLRHLFSLDSLGELLAKRHVGDGHVLQLDVELRGALLQVVSDLVGHHLSHRDQLRGVELRHRGLQDLVSDRRQHSLVVVEPQVLVDGREIHHVGSVQHPQRDGHRLEVLRACRRRDCSWSCLHVEDDWSLQPRHNKVDALADHVGLDSREPVKDDGSLTALDVVHGVVGQENQCRHRQGQSGDGVGDSGHIAVCVLSRCLSLYPAASASASAAVASASASATPARRLLSLSPPASLLPGLSFCPRGCSALCAEQSISGKEKGQAVDRRGSFRIRQVVVAGSNLRRGAIERRLKQVSSCRRRICCCRRRGGCRSPG